MTDPDRRADDIARLQRQWAKQDRLDMEDSVRALLSLRNGRRFLVWLLTVGKSIGLNPYASSDRDTAFQCGEMNVGLQLMNLLIEVDPDGYVKLLTEMANERKERSELEASAGDEPRDGSGGLDG